MSFMHAINKNPIILPKTFCNWTEKYLKGKQIANILH